MFSDLVLLLQRTCPCLWPGEGFRVTMVIGVLVHRAHWEWAGRVDRGSLSSLCGRWLVRGVACPGDAGTDDEGSGVS